MYNYQPMNTRESGFEELPHSAGWQLRVWAESLPALFGEATRGRNALSSAKPAPGPRLTRSFEAEAPDTEGLLFAFLYDLIWAAEQENLVIDKFSLVLKGSLLKVRMSGSNILSLDKSIKAVTYHNFHIQKNGGWV